MCNLFENVSPSEWLLYISEWEYNGQTLSNIRVTTKVAVHCILSSCPVLKNIGSMMLYNIAIKEVKTVVSTAFYWRLKGFLFNFRFLFSQGFR